MYYNPARNSSIRPDLPFLPSAATHQSPFGPLPLLHLILSFFSPLFIATVNCLCLCLCLFAISREFLAPAGTAN